MQAAITSKNEGYLFNIANSFGIRHVNDKQKTNYDANVSSMPITSEIDIN